MSEAINWPEVLANPFSQQDIERLAAQVAATHADALARYPIKFFFGGTNDELRKIHNNEALRLLPQAVVLAEDMYVVALNYINGMEAIGDGAMPVISMIAGLMRLSPIQTASGLAGLVSAANKREKFATGMPALSALHGVLKNYIMVRTDPAGLALIRTAWETRAGSANSASVFVTCERGLKLDRVINVA